MSTSTESLEEVNANLEKCSSSDKIHTNISVLLSIEYHADNAFILEEPTKLFKLEKLRVLASQGGVIKITRDESVPRFQNKYTIEPSLSMDQSEVWVDDNF